MIHELRNINPYIDFGFGVTRLTVSAQKPVTVWLSTLYSKDAYAFTLWADDSSTVTKISDYEHILTYNTPGNYQISLSVIRRDIKASIQSNILKLTVV